MKKKPKGNVVDFLFRGLNNGKLVLGSYVHDRFENKHYIYSNHYGDWKTTKDSKPIMAFEIEKESLGMCTELKDRNGNQLVTRDVLVDKNGDMYLFDWDFDEYRLCLQNMKTNKKIYQGFGEMESQGILVGKGEDSKFLKFVRK